MSMSCANTRFADYRGRHRGETVVVCGCGVSLRQLHRPESFVTIGVNDVGRLFTPDYLIVVNERRQFTPERYAYVQTSQAKAVFSQLDLAHPRAVRFRLGRRGGTGPIEGDSLDYTNNSPYVAINLARYMGAARIGLIGVDFGDDHFFGSTGRHPLAGQLAQIDREYGALGAACCDEGTELVNLSPVSRLTSLPRASLDVWLASGERIAVRPEEPPSARAAARRVFFVHYRFLSCGNVFDTGLREAAATLGIAAEHADWDDAQLPQKVEHFRPDLLFVVHGRRFVHCWGNRLSKWRSAVWLLDEPYEVDDTASWSGRFDLAFLNDAASLPRHQRAHALPVAYAPILHYTSLAGERTRRVGFIGGANPARERLLGHLARRGLLDYVVGGPWGDSRLNALCLSGNVPAERTAALYRDTDIIVNVFRDRHHFNRAGIKGRALNPRIYEALACGALVISESRDELARLVPELPTFRSEGEAAALIEGFLATADERLRVQRACGARLAEATYAQRLRTVMDIAFENPKRPSVEDMSQTQISTPSTVSDTIECERVVPFDDDWNDLGGVVRRATDNTMVIEAATQRGPGAERGLTSRMRFDSVDLTFDACLGPGACLVAKVHQADAVDQTSNSYHLYVDERRAYLARHHHIFQQFESPRLNWTRFRLVCCGGVLSLWRNDRLLHRVRDQALTGGYAFIGVQGGSVRVRQLRVSTTDQARASARAREKVEHVTHAPKSTGGDRTSSSTQTSRLAANCSINATVPLCQTSLKGWRSYRGSATISRDGEVMLSKAYVDNPGSETGLVSVDPYNEVELSFDLWLNTDSWFIAKIHQLDPIDQTTNSYHIVSQRNASYVAKHHTVLGCLSIARGLWQRIVFRWVDGLLEVLVNNVAVMQLSESELQSGFCFIGVKGGRAKLKRINLGQASERTRPDPTDLANGQTMHNQIGLNICISRKNDCPQPGKEPWPFTAMPRRNLLYHIWPTRGSMWTWNLDQLKDRLDMFNGRRIVGIVHDDRSEPPERVKEYLDGHGFEFVINRNDDRGEAISFPPMMERIASTDPNEITFYGHAKGVKYEPDVPAPVKRWSEVQYRVALDDWSTVHTHLERFAMTGPFRMLGQFRAHRYLASWHYSGTYFWFRNAHVFSRSPLRIPQFYGGVETWPGMLFDQAETGCLFMDSLRQLPYHQDFWHHAAEPAFEKWKSGVRQFLPPPDLVQPSSYKGYIQPRMEQKPDEFGWWVDRLLRIEVARVLTIGSKEGGVEWHLAREFFEHGRNIEITAIEKNPAPQLMETLREAERRFHQSLRLVIGDSSAKSTRTQLADQYDVVFIDGDHSYKVCRSDFTLAESLGPKLIGLHDIVDSNWHVSAHCCVSRLWAELSKKYHTEQSASGEWGGIGIVVFDH
jgi:hypothetical protein